MAVFLDQANNRHRVHWRMFLEGDRDHRGRGFNLLHAKGLRQNAKTMHINQGGRGLRHFPEAIDQLFHQMINLLIRSSGGQLFVKRQAQMHIAAVIIGQKRR